MIGRTEKVANPVLHRFTGEERLFKNDQDEKYIREILADIDGHCLGINHFDEMSGKTSVKVFKAESDAQNITLTFDIRTPVTLDIDDVVEKLIAYGKKTGLEVKIVKVSKGYYKKPENEIVSMLTELYNKEFNANEKPYVMGACTYARLFDNGCGFGGGNPHEVKPFPKGHGAAHGADAVSYTHLDVYKRQFMRRSQSSIITLPFISKKPSPSMHSASTSSSAPA